MKGFALVSLACMLVVAAGCDDSGSTSTDMLATDTGADTTVDMAAAPDGTGDAVPDLPETDTAAPDVSTTDLGPDQAPDLGADQVADQGADTTADGADSTPDTSPDTQASDLLSQDLADASPPTALDCFMDINPGGAIGGPDYDQFNPIVGSHCLGTNHQDISGVEKVVFIGDSVTVGTPNSSHLLPSDNAHFYRNQLAEYLATTFALDKGNAISWGLWKSYDPVNGTGTQMTSGDFSHCAKWGARTDDFLMGGNQLASCFPSTPVNEKTLIVFTMGGNDIANITQEGADGDIATAMMTATDTVVFLRTAAEWMKDPTNFPNGSYVLFGNPFEFTDATGDVSACPAANIAGFTDWQDPTILEGIVTTILEEYMRIAVDTQSDMIWMLEHFCGHGYVATGANADVNNRCYRGPATPRWFDESCTHPNDAGHAAIYEMFRAVIEE